MSASVARITMVRMNVAKSALTFSTPTLAKIAVSAANTADSTAHSCHDDVTPFMSGFAHFAHIAGLAAGEKIGTRRREDVDHLGVLVEPALVLDAARDHHDVARPAHAALVADAELHAAFEHPHDLLVGVLMGFHMHARLHAPPHDHALLAGYDPARNLVADAFFRQRREGAEASQSRHAVPLLAR